LQILKAHAKKTVNQQKPIVLPIAIILHWNPVEIQKKYKIEAPYYYSTFDVSIRSSTVFITVDTFCF
jgi:hypothetical protein